MSYKSNFKSMKPIQHYFTHSFYTKWLFNKIAVIIVAVLLSHSSTYSQALSDNFSGIKPVYIRLVPQSFAARLMAGIAKPEGKALVKFTPLTDGSIQLQFCNASGKVVVSSYNGTGFSAGRMPKQLYLMDVRIRIDGKNIKDGKNGANHVRILPVEDRPVTNADDLKEAKDSYNAKVKTTPYDGKKFTIEIVLNLSVNFNAVITEL